MATCHREIVHCGELGWDVSRRECHHWYSSSGCCELEEVLIIKTVGTERFAK